MPRFEEIPHALASDPSIARSFSSETFEIRQQLLSRLSYSLGLGRRHRIVNRIPLTKPTNQCVTLMHLGINSANRKTLPSIKLEVTLCFDSFAVRPRRVGGLLRVNWRSSDEQRRRCEKNLTNQRIRNHRLSERVLLGLCRERGLG